MGLSTYAHSSSSSPRRTTAGVQRHPRRYLAAAAGVTLCLVGFAGPAESATKNSRKKSTTCTAAEVVALVPTSVSVSVPFKADAVGLDASKVQCINGDMEAYGPDARAATFRISAMLSLSKPDGTRGNVTGSLITEVGFPAASPQRVEANVTGSYRCANGTCAVKARAMKAGKAIASLKGTMKLAPASDPTLSNQPEMEEVGFVFHNITWTYREGGTNDTTR